MQNKINPEQVSKKKEAEQPEFIKILAQLSTEDLLAYLMEKGKRLGGSLDTSEYASPNNSVFYHLNIKQHQIIPHKPGEGATLLAFNLEMLNRSLVNQITTIPIDLSLIRNKKDLDKAIISSLGRLIEFIEILDKYFYFDSDPIKTQELLTAFAQIIKVGGNPMKRMIAKMISKSAHNNPFNELMGNTQIAKRIPNQYISLSKESSKFLKDALKLSRTAQSPKSISETIDLIRTCLGKKANTIQLVADIPNSRKAKQQLDALTNQKLLAELQQQNVFLKIFSPISVRPNKNYSIETQVFQWSDKKIIKMLDMIFRNAQSRYTAGGFVSRDWDYQPHLLKFCDKNPRKAVLLLHDLLEVSHSPNTIVNNEPKPITIHPEIWNMVCENWNHPIRGPRKVKIN